MIITVQTLMLCFAIHITDRHKRLTVNRRPTQKQSVHRQLFQDSNTDEEVRMQQLFGAIIRYFVNQCTNICIQVLRFAAALFIP